MTVSTALAAALRNHARGAYSLETAAELLIAHRRWLHRADFTRHLIEFTDDLVDGRAMAMVDWPAAITLLQAGGLPCSGGEHRILRIAASLAEGIPIDLRDALTGLDETNLDLVASAVRHAGGRRPVPDLTGDRHLSRAGSPCCRRSNEPPR